VILISNLIWFFILITQTARVEWCNWRAGWPMYQALQYSSCIAHLTQDRFWSI
jgi:hypothetical protein